MKKIFALALALILLAAAALAEIDWASMDDATIQAEINNAHSELVKRELVGNTENVTVFDEAGITIVFKTMEVDDEDWAYKPALVVNTTIVSESSKDMEIGIHNAAINGWEVDNTGYYEIAAGHKEKVSLKFKLEDADVTSFDELETLEISFVYDKGDYNYTHTDPVTIQFK